MLLLQSNGIHICYLLSEWFVQKKKKKKNKPQTPRLSPFNSQDLISNSTYCLPYSSCDISFENLVLDQLITLQMIFFLVFITCLLDSVLISLGEILSWSPMGNWIWNNFDLRLIRPWALYVLLLILGAALTCMCSTTNESTSSPLIQKQTWRSIKGDYYTDYLLKLNHLIIEMQD